MNGKIWKKFYECSCGGEGIMASYDYAEDGVPAVDVAFFQHGLTSDRKLSLAQKLRWCWEILIKGTAFVDMVMLNQSVAKDLGNDLIEFSKKQYKFGEKQ